MTSGPGPHSPTTPATDGPMPKPPVIITAAVRGPDAAPRRAAASTSQALPTLKTMPEAAPCRNLAR